MPSKKFHYIIVSTAHDGRLYLQDQRNWTRDPFEAWSFSQPKFADAWGQQLLFAGYRVLQREQLSPPTTT